MKTNFMIDNQIYLHTKQNTKMNTNKTSIIFLLSFLDE